MQVTDNETWVTNLNDKTKKQLKLWMQPLTKQTNKVQTNIACLEN
jgi:predicted ATPase